MLSQNDKKFYLENGYLILNDKLDKQTIINLQNATQQMINEFKKNQESFTNDKKRNIRI